MTLFVANGVDVDPSLTEVISFSKDGSNWNHLNKNNLSIVTAFINHNPPSPVTGTTRGQKTLVYIRDQNRTLMRFDAQDVAVGTGLGEHTTWQAGTEAALEIVNTEMTGWLS